MKSKPERIRRKGPWLPVLALAAMGVGCTPPAPQRPAETTWSAMGTFASVTVPAAETHRLADCAEATRGAFEEVEEAVSLFRPRSDLSRINASAGQAPLRIGPLTRDVLGISVRYARISGGAFDPTVAPLVLFWGFHGGRAPSSLPTDEALREVRTKVGYRGLVLSNDTARLAAEGMKLDLGGIAKGYGVDLAFGRLAARGATNLMVNLGGNLRCAGSPGTRPQWRIGVQNPFVRGGQVGALALSGGMAAATSGNYEQFVTIAGKRFTHIIDPRTGMPVAGMAGVTVVSPTAVEADALSTSLFVSGIEGAAAILAQTPGAEALLIPDAQPPRIYVSAGMRSRFEPYPEFRDAVTLLPPHAAAEGGGR